MQTILKKITDNKYEELIETKKQRPLNMFYEQIKNTLTTPRDFKLALTKNDINIIAELKKASPSKGDLATDLDIIHYAQIYEKSKAAAISVLTENKFFKGNIHYLKQVSQLVSIPVLRKDFIIDPYQIFEARFFGADAILLIAAILDDKTLVDFLSVTKTLKMQALVEVHTQEELDRVLQTKAEIIGINNRNLENFEVDIKTTAKLLKGLSPETRKNKVFVSESGISTKGHIDFLMRSDINAFLIGEAIVKNDQPEQFFKAMLK
ncbi:MAG: indole-3-glycerol phosphate synthase TrpC [bacterium]|nr:indole-3-glycerol phosphate synthase TrpC [bacterium]